MNMRVIVVRSTLIITNITHSTRGQRILNGPEKELKTPYLWRKMNLDVADPGKMKRKEKRYDVQ